MRAAALESDRSGWILQFHPADARPIVERGGQAQRHRRRAALDLRPRPLGRQAREIDLGLTEDFGIGGIGLQAILVVGLGRPDFDQAIEESLVALRRFQPVGDLFLQRSKLGLRDRMARGVGLFHGRHGDFPALDFFRMFKSLAVERADLIDDSLTG